MPTPASTASPKGSHARPMRTGVRALLWGALVLVLALWSHLPVLTGPLVGQDEAEQLRLVSNLVYDLQTFDFSKDKLIRLVYPLSTAPHPPLRYLLSAPGMALFPDTVLGLRLLAVLASLYMTWQVFLLGRELGGRGLGLAAAVLVAASGVYNWTSMAFAWGLATAMLIKALRLLREASLDLGAAAERRRLRRVLACLTVAFLINPGNLLLLAATAGLYLWANRRRVGVVIRCATPFLLFFLLYYAYFFLAFPLYAHLVQGAPWPNGQLAHHLMRASGSGPNLSALAENLQTVNAYFLPYLSWLLLLAAGWHLWRHQRRLLLWWLPYALVWSLWMQGDTGQYFLLMFIALLPYGLAGLRQWLRGRAAVASVAAVALLVGGWNYLLFIRLEPGYTLARRLCTWGLARVERRHNYLKPPHDPKAWVRESPLKALGLRTAPGYWPPAQGVPCTEEGP